MNFRSKIAGTLRSLLSLAISIRLRRSGASIGNGVRFIGKPYFHITRGSIFAIGDNVTFSSGFKGNPLCGCDRISICTSTPTSEIIIGNNVGISCATIFSSKQIKIGNFVNIGAGVHIYDTDFHPLEAEARRLHTIEMIASEPVVIEDDVWIGAGAKILKGVTIGKGSIIAAGAVVSKSVPSYVIAAGIPAQTVRKLN